MMFLNNYDESTKFNQDESVPKWLRDFRKTNLDRFTQIGVPTVKDEEWKYTDLSALAKEKFDLPTEKIPAKDIERLKNFCDTDSIHVVFINGKFCDQLSIIDDLPKGVTVTNLKDFISSQNGSVEKLFNQYDQANETSFVALNNALASEGVVINVEKNVVCERLIRIIHFSDCPNEKLAQFSKAFINLGQSSEITVIETFISAQQDAQYLNCPLTDIRLAQNATIHYCRSQSDSLNAFHISQTRVFQEANSNFDGFSLTSGAKLTRNNLDIVLTGEGANATLNGLYSIHKDQHVDNHTSVDHRVPNCTSNQLYKGILNDDAHAVFNGKIFVKDIAQQTNSYQLNKNLLLGKNCRVDTKPQLEIFADDVKCTHGATVGQLNEDEIFYLQTRCVPRKKAIQIIARGFAYELVEMIADPQIRDQIKHLIEPSFNALGN